MSYKDTKVYYSHVHEDVLKQLNNSIFAVEELFRPGHPTRQQLYRLRVSLGQITMMNRQDQDWPQDVSVRDTAEVAGGENGN